MRHDTLDLIQTKEAYEELLDNQFGEPPVNIFKYLRNQIGYSHETLAKQMYASKQSLIRLEQGCYDTPLPVAVEWWAHRSNVHGVTELSLMHQYEEFQEKMRIRHFHYFGSGLLQHSWNKHPLVELRQPNDVRPFPVSVTEVAKALCLHQSTLQHWEIKWRLQKSVPKGFQQALSTIGYDTQSIRQFNQFYHLWRMNKLGRA